MNEDYEYVSKKTEEVKLELLQPDLSEEEIIIKKYALQILHEAAVLSLIEPKGFYYLAIEFPEIISEFLLGLAKRKKQAGMEASLENYFENISELIIDSHVKTVRNRFRLIK